MTRAELLALAARVERAEWQDKELDAEIAVAVYGGEIVWKTASGTMTQYAARKYASAQHIGGFGYAPVPAFTTSLDAAASLVPEDVGWMLTKQKQPDMGGRAWNAAISETRHIRGKAATPALALTAAALRAKTEEMKE